MSWSEVTDYDTANARVTSLATFMGGLSFVSLVFSINIMTGKQREATYELLAAESIVVLFLLSAIVIFLTSAVTLTSAYYESGVPLEIGVRRARRLNVAGTMLTLWAVAALLLVAFNFSAQGQAYAVAAAIAPVAFALVRRKQEIAL